jgi:hypothetical protein
MHFSHHFPGLLRAPVIESVARLTPEQTSVLWAEGCKLLDSELEERIAHTKAVAAAAGMRLI